MAIRAFDEWQQPVFLVGFFGSNEIPGACPALWCYESMCYVDSHVACVEATVKMTVEEEPLWAPCEATKSGHLLLPIDNWDVTSAQLMASEAEHVFHSRELLVLEYWQYQYHGLEAVSEVSEKQMESLEDLIHK